jgi:sporulation protein YlmC with PRC-barrel domain
VSSLRNAVGKPVILRSTAEQAGKIRAFAIDAASLRVTTLVLKAGRSARLVDWQQIESIGPDAIIIRDSREAVADDDRIVSGALDPLQKRVLSDAGNEIGAISDVTVDDDGSVGSLEIAGSPVAGTRLRGIGSYAVVIAAEPGEA